jgi:hypothetical protein
MTDLALSHLSESGLRMLAPEAFETDSARDLAHIHENRFNLGIWTRRQVRYPELRAFPNLEKQIIPSRDGPPVRLEHLSPAWALEARESGVEPVLRDWNALIALFSRISSAPKFCVKIEWEVTDACSLFHQDRVGIRMLCTYKGPGTEWIPEAYLNRKGLGQGDNSLVILDTAQIQRAKVYDVLVLKGSLYPDNEHRGVVHRSPSIECCNESRAVIRIDEVWK